jgi:hypothetical protein
MLSLTLTPLAPWQAAHTVSALAFPAATSAAPAQGATTSMADNAISFLMMFLLVPREQRISGPHSMR